MEEQLRISEKMASLGLLAAGVAHEVNTPLTGISSYTQMLLESADPADPRTPLLEKIEKQTFRAARIVNGLLNLSRPNAAEASERSVVDLNAVIGDVLSLLEHQFEKGSIKVRRELSAEPVRVIGFEFKLQQVFLNLFLNARDAMTSGGWLTISTTARRPRGGRRGRRHRRRHSARAPRAHLRSVLHDQADGPGHRPRPVDHLRHRARARSHHPVRQRAAARARASSFSFAAAPVRRPPHTADEQTRHAHGTLQYSSSTTKKSCGTSLARCSSARATACAWPAAGQEGLDLAKSLPFDAVIVDVMMPGIDGLQVLDELKKHDDDLPVLMITAYASMESAIAAMKKGAFDYITKPFKNDEVLVVLRNAVERRQLVAENVALKQNLQARYHKFAGIIGKSSRMKQVFDLIIQAAPSRSTILITGESGTGKELVARAIHSNSARSERSFVDGQLRQPAARPAGIDAVRPRQGRVHRRRLSEEGPVRPRRQGQHLLRRDRQRPDRDAGQAAARDAGARVHAPRRHGDDQGRRPHHRRDQRRPEARDGGGPLPRRPLSTGCTSSAFTCRRCASGATTFRCWCSTSSRSTAKRTTARTSRSRPKRSTC